MAGRRTEYWSGQETHSAQSMAALAKANDETVLNGYDSTNEENLKAGLEGAALVLGWIAITIASTAASVAGAVVGTVAALSIGEKGIVRQVLHNGKDSLSAIVVDMVDGSWTDVKVTMPILEFTDEGYKMVQGNCYVHQYKKNGTWYTLNKNY